jgi:hypothetical protein
VRSKPVGLFIPPSYMERKMKRIYLPFLSDLEKAGSLLPFLSDAGDHVFIELTRNK